MPDEPAPNHTGSRSYLELLYDISRALASDLDLQTVLRRVLLLTTEAVGGERGSVVVLDSAGSAVDSAMVYSGRVQVHTTEQLSELIKKGLAGWVAEHRQPVIIPDTSQDERWLKRPDDAPDQTGPKSAMSTPLLAHDDLVGVMTIVHPRPGTFTDQHLTLMRAIADQAGISILNARLYEESRAAHRRYRELFDDSIDLILITARDGTIRQFNRQAEGALPQVAGGSALPNIFDLHRLPEDLSAADLLARVDSRQTVSYETAVGHPDPVKPVQLFVRGIQLEGEDLLQWILHDITERKAIDALQAELTSMIYHDLRAPLGNVAYSLDMIGTMLPEVDGNVKSLLEIALRATDRIERLTHSLLDLRYLEAGQPLKNLENANAAQLLEYAFNEIRPLAEGKNQEMAMTAEDGDAVVQVDKDMIGRVLINLIENAVKYTPVGGRIEPGLKRADGGVVFWVQDNGPGIPMDQRAVVFNKFARLGGGRHGFGLGLAFCRLAVEAHQGKIWIEDVDGQGVRFAFQLPEVKG